MEKKKRRKLQNIIVVQMYEIVKIQMHFQSNYFICRSWKIIFKWFILIFSIWTKYEKDNNGQSWVLLYETKDNVG